MKIPKQFNILGHTVYIVWNTDRLNDINAVGLAEPTLDTITLTKKVDGKTLSKETIEHTYLHEVTHIILKTMGENELYENEKFIDMFSGLLHQVITSSK